MNRIASTLLGGGLLLFSHLTCAEVPRGWMANGSALNDFTVATDASVPYQGHPSVSISAKKTDSSGFAGLMQSISANDYKGKRVRLSACVKTQAVTEEGSRGAHVWFRVDGPDEKMLGFDNMDTRPIKGSTEWTRYDIVLEVPTESIGLAYGSFLNGTGTCWVASFSLEPVGDSVPLTNSLPQHPVNLNFDQ